MFLSAIHRRTQGFALMECLFAILVFAVGILALLSLQAVSVRESGAAKYRTDASLLADRLIGEMWVSNRSATALSDNFASPNGAAYLTWKASVLATLPGSVDPAVTVTTPAGVSGSRVTITVSWKEPSDAATAPAHKYTVVTQIM